MLQVKICLVNLGSVALFSQAKLNIVSNKRLEKVEKFQTNFLIHKNSIILYWDKSVLQRL